MPTIRILRLPWWWLLFPPLVHGIVSGNVQLLLVPLILWRAGWVAGLLKVYGIVPDALLGHWRQLVALGVALLVTAPILPWGLYLSRIGEINAALSCQPELRPSSAATRGTGS